MGVIAASSRRRFALFMGVILAMLGGWLLLPSGSQEGLLPRASYDAAFRLDPGSRRSSGPSPVVLVYLDLESHLRERLPLSEPWPRALHARLMKRLTAAGARAVLFDIVFSGPGPDPAADASLSAAFRENGNVWLAAERNQWDRETESAAVAAQSVVLPHAVLRDAAAGWGLAVLRPEDDFMVRRSWLGPGADGAPALTWAVAEGLGLSPPRREWLRYLGGPLALPHVGFSAALRQDEVPDDFFRDRVVVVGAQPMVGGFVERRDEFRNPFGRFALGRVFMPAVEVHATQLVNLLRGDGLRRPGPAIEAGGVLLIALLAAWGLGRLRPMPVLAALLGAELVLLASVSVGMHWDLWFPWMIPGLIQLPGAVDAGGGSGGTGGDPGSIPVGPSLEGVRYRFATGETPDLLTFNTATAGVEQGDSDATPFTYTFSKSGDSSALLVIRFKADKWDEYDLSYAGGNRGTFVRREFDKGTLKDTDHGTFTGL